MRQCDWLVRVCHTDNYDVWYQWSTLSLYQSLLYHSRQCVSVFYPQLTLSHQGEPEPWLQYRGISMEKDEAYHSTLSVHCWWEKSAEECSTYEQSHYYRALHKVSQFDNQYKDKNQLVTIW